MFGLSFGGRLFIFIVGLAVGFFFLLKPLFIVNSIGKSEWAEVNLPGGTYGAVKLFGLLIMAVAIIIMFKT